MDNVALELADKFKSVGVSTVYGEIVDVDGVKIVPVALASFGFGAGEGDASSDIKADNKAAGGGGGGGGMSVPIGAYIRTSDGVRFEPNLVSLLTVAIPFVWVLGKALKVIIKALKK
ncbi:Sporulation protein YtfJ (Spore_YtfJ) [Paramicrobacterium humi]|uniref:Sporulation protein YtfJ (Spore_YtfJ) n=1 Tax=Paramicrobacterium humi TaxID=640635 RepID=A0A1H4TRW2_9MICO|nr:spore germination protein GerW family protein [Microbacterium humi]SEC59225.1 Sporulation protein YtfJ (Spore_YtfJ) [Microbacterium humi]